MLNVINIQLRRRPEFLIKILHSFSKDQYDPVLLPYSASGVVLIPALIKEFAKEKGETNADMNVCRDSQRFFYLWQFFFFFLLVFSVSVETKLVLRKNSACEISPLFSPILHHPLMIQDIITRASRCLSVFL